MSRKLRVFVSSTMKDLANERQAVVSRIAGYNFEPVNAENLFPNGHKSWDLIKDEIESSDLFVLILGEKYGWIPPNPTEYGPGLSVTHLEYKKAQGVGVPILPFLKKLDYDNVERDTDDAKNRDNFRAEVKDWDKGYFVTQFNLAQDLADSVGNSLIAEIGNAFKNQKMRERSAHINANKFSSLIQPAEKTPLSPPLTLPSNLVEAVKSQQAVLFAGAGISMAAGLPSSEAFAEKFLQIVRQKDSSYTVNPTGTAFAGIATDVEAAGGRTLLEKAVLDIMNLPQKIEPTNAHRLAVEIFDQIFTTNYDGLFEEASRKHDSGHVIINKETPAGYLPRKCIVKLHGSITEPDSLVLTERDVFMLDATHLHLLSQLRSVLTTKTVIVIGTALRDPSVIRLFETAAGVLSGYYIAPKLWDFTQSRVSHWNLKTIKTDANVFMDTLSKQVRE